MTRRVRFRGLILALLLGASGSALAHPALWVVKDADTTIYLFGTVHLLPNDVDWHFPVLDQARILRLFDYAGACGWGRQSDGFHS